MGTVSSNLALYSALVGAFLPVAISAIQQWHWPTHVRSLVAFAACAVAAAGTAWLDGDLTAKGITAAVLIVLTTARSSYAALWKPTGILDRVEAKTSGTTVATVQAATGSAPPLTPNDVRDIVGMAMQNQTSSAANSTASAVVTASAGSALGSAHRPSRDVVGDSPAPIPPDQDPLVAASRDE